MDREAKLFRKILRQNRYYVSQPRFSLFRLLQDMNSITVRQLITRLPRQDRATVYRNIKMFEKLGIINRLRLGWHSKIELSDIFKHHHHHMSCTNCGKVYVLKDNLTIEREIARISRGTKFQAMDHQLEIRGLCQNCRKLSLV